MTTERNGTYRGEALRAVAMPLGGLGTGTIALAGDGSLRQWQIHNQVNHLGQVPHSFFAIWTRGHRPPSPTIAKVLQTAALYDHDGVTPPPTTNDHEVPSAHRDLLDRFPGVDGIEYTGRYPIAELAYLDDELPLDIRLEAFNPFVPLDPDESGIPAILFTFTITNTADRVIKASIAGTLQNAVGWDGIVPIDSVRCQQYGGNVNAVTRLSGQTVIAMTNDWLKPLDPANGSTALAVDSTEASYLIGWTDLDGFWNDFVSDGRLEGSGEVGPSRRGQTQNGALAVSMKLQPGETRTVRFTMSWHFPNRTVNWSQRPFFNFTDEQSTFWLGNRYNTRFASALDVAAYVGRERDRLTDLTRQARDTFYDTTLPFNLIDAVTSQMSVARTPTCFWTADGNFYGFEGCNGISTWHTEPWGGSCPLNCTHVWNYEMSLARLFPTLERTMRDTEWHIQQHATGYLPHRVLMPTYLPRPWERPIGGPHNPALDGLLGAILKSYREFLASGDPAWLNRIWPHLKLALDHLWTAHDPARAGIIQGEQPNTYDISIYGPNTFIGTLYLASLRAMEEFARRQGDENLAAECRRVFERGREAYETLWNGEFYIQRVDLDQYPEQNWGIGCHTDQLLGQWWANLLGLGDLLDPVRVKSATKAIATHNFRTSFAGFEQSPRIYCTDDDQGLLLCTWPNGGRPDVPTQYSDEVWTGMEYEVAALLLAQGEVNEAMKLINATRQRYNGTKQNPWNDIECGDHYARAMSSWSLLEAASGYYYDASTATIGFAPTIGAGAFKAPFVARDGWGTVEQRIDGDGHRLTIRVNHGRLDLAQVRLVASSPLATVAATLDGRDVSASRDCDQIQFGDVVSIGEGEVLALHLN